jgi:hypothetical protein
MSQTQQHTDGIQTIKEVVKKTLWDAKKPRSNFFLFLELAIDAYRELRLHAVTEGKMWKKCTVTTFSGGATDTGYIDFPEEFEDFIGVYVPIDGELWSLTRRDSIIQTTSLTGIIETQDSTKGEGVDVLHAPYTDSGGQNMRGYYAIDWDNRRIFLNGIDVTEVVLLYKSSGVGINTTTWIPNKYIPCMIAKILFAFVQYDDNISSSRRQELLFNMQQEEIKLRNLESPTLDEFMDVIYSTYYGTPKR